LPELRVPTNDPAKPQQVAALQHTI